MSGASVRRLSAAGRGAIAVVEVRGPGALERVSSLAPGTSLVPGDLSLVALRSAGEVLDRALVAVGGEGEVELYLHGSPDLVAEVLAALGGESREGEPASLEQAARRLLERAPCEDAARLLLDQAEGALRRELEGLLHLSDGDLRARVEVLLERARVARYALRPVRVLLRGPVNAGKSTLFNALCASERMLVSDEPGTTRDVVREHVLFGAWPVELWDTPGEREHAAGESRALELERAGLALARELERAAEWVLWLAPPGARAPDAAAWGGRLELLESRADELRSAAPHAISALTDPLGAVRAVSARFRARFTLPASPWSAGAAVPFEERQVEVLAALRDAPHDRRLASLEVLLGARVDPGGDGG